MNQHQNKKSSLDHSAIIKKKTTMKDENKIVMGAAYRRKQQILTMLLEANTNAFLAKANIQQGMQGLVLNSEEGDLTRVLAEAVTKTGNIVGVDTHSLNIEIAKQHAVNSNYNNIQYFLSEEKDAYQSQKYDFVFARFLFSKSQNPGKEAEQVFQLLKPGGLFLYQEMDFLKHYCFPSNFAFTRYLDLYAKLAKKQGLDIRIGGQLNPILKAKGFNNIRSYQVQSFFLNGLAKSFSSLMLESISDQLIYENLALDIEVNALVEELKYFEQQPETILSLPGLYQAQAQKL